LSELGAALESQGPDLLAGERPGFRLSRFEVYNWGTFHSHIWGFDLGGDNALLTGDIGSGKSTYVDAITTLLVPPQKLSYNKAAGAEARERTLRTYVLGHYKSERTESGSAARPVALRDCNSYSVILGRFSNHELGQQVTLAQVFWFKEQQGQPARFYVLADKALSVAEHFAGFGTDINDMRKRLRVMTRVEVFDSFPAYGSAYRRRFGIENEQAIELFHQTVSMKSVGNLTDFVREHMLEASDVEPHIGALIGHFDNLNRAHDAVLKAKKQIELLLPLVADCDEHAEISARVEAQRSCREALRPWFASLKRELLEKRLIHLEAELVRLVRRIASLTESRDRQRAERDDVKQAIASNGGDRIERLKKEIGDRQVEREERSRRAEQYDSLARNIGLPWGTDAEVFQTNQRSIESERDSSEALLAQTQNALTEANVGLHEWKRQYDELAAELQSLRQRRSNIPRRMLDLRESLCRSTGLRDETLPFAGELIQVRPGDGDWEGAIERVLRGVGLSMLVPDTQYARVAEWVDRTHLGEHLVYYRVRDQRMSDRSSLHPASLVRKLAIKPDSIFYDWLEGELARRFDYACCNTLDEFRREPRAITRAGQTKGRGERHEKDDRHLIDDRSRFVLGWSNEAKIAALEKQAHDMEARTRAAERRIAALDVERKTLRVRLAALEQLAVFKSFRDLDWKPLVAEIERLEREWRQLEQASDVLRTLERQLSALERTLEETDRELERQKDERTRVEERREQAHMESANCETLLAATPEAAKAKYFPQLEAMRPEAFGEHVLTVESCDNRERDMREWLQSKIDAEDHRSRRLMERIVKAMENYCNLHPLETQELDRSVEAASGYRTMLEDLKSDDLPRFEARFKELLNENTIREVANFHSQLSRGRETIGERIGRINQSLRQIDYSPGRYIVLEAETTGDPEIRDFQQDLRACTEGALTGSEGEEYSEAKFLQVKRIIERLRGREGLAELDRRWTRKVSDVRNWFTFSASERWREDNREHEHYTDSGGKSGGQKEKLAYTVLAASLAYQFGLEWGASRSRSFRFVVIDEAFGRGSDESARYGLELFRRLNLQLLIVTPLQKIHIIEPYVSAVGFVHNEDGRLSLLRNLTIEEYRAERSTRSA
jgi:uncharacterized protein YPO0396